MASYERYTLKSGEKRWRVYWQQPDHRQRNKSGFRRKIDAEDWIARNVTTAINDGAYVDPQGGRTLIRGLGEQWIAAHKSVWKPSHEYSIESSWKAHVCPKWGDRRLADVTHSEVQRWVNDLASERSASVVLRAFGILRNIYQTAVKDGLIVRVPVDDIQLPRKQRRQHVYLTVEQLHRLADCSGAYKPLILVLGLCGLRWGEATALTVKDIDFEKNRIHVNKSVSQVGGRFEVSTPKNHKNRDVPMFQPVRDALNHAVKGKRPDDLVFVGPNGGYVIGQSIGITRHGWYLNALKEACVPKLRPHDLRHTAASIAVHAGANVKAVQRMLGHSSAAMTLDVYADLFEDDLDVLATKVSNAISGVF